VIPARRQLQGSTQHSRVTLTFTPESIANGVLELLAMLRRPG
jgi:hypothetical protein